MTDDSDSPTDPTAFLRRTVLRAVGAGTALSLAGAQTAGATAATDATTTNGSAPPTGGVANIDPIFGLASAGPNPCMGDAPADCVEEAHPSVTVDHEVELHIDIPGVLFAVAGQGGLSQETTANVNAAVGDGRVDESELDRPDAEVRIQGPDGPTTVTVLEIAQALASTTGFHFEPAGLHLRPGETVLFSAETPDHGVAVFHERHGRQNRVPDGVGPVASPLVPVGGYWLQRFRRPGVYDYNCPPHEVFGMVGSLVVAGASADAPARSVEQTGRPPEEESLLPLILGGLDPNVPSSMQALETAALSPENVKAEGAVSWKTVVDEHRQNGGA